MSRTAADSLLILGLLMIYCGLFHAALRGRAPTFTRLPAVTFISLVVVNFLPGLSFVGAREFPKASEYMWGHWLFVTGLLAGTVLALAALPRSPMGAGYYRPGGHQVSSSDDSSRVVRIAWANIILLACYIPLTRFRWPLIELLLGSTGSAGINELRRSVFGPSLGPLWPLFALARTTFVPITFCIMVGSRPGLKRPNERRVVTTGIAAAVTYNSWSSAKTPVVMLLVLTGLSLWLQGKIKAPRMLDQLGNKRSTRARLALILVLAIAYPSFLFSQKTFGEDKPMSEIVTEGVVGRISGKPALLAYIQFEIFPGRMDHIGIRDIRLLTSALDLDYVELSSVTSSATGRSSKSNAPPGGPANLYSQFGRNGMLLGGVLVGLGLVTLEYYLVLNRLGPVSAAAFASFSIWLAFRISVTGVHSVLASEGVVPMIMLLMWWKRPFRRRVSILATKGEEDTESGSKDTGGRAALPVAIPAAP